MIVGLGVKVTYPVTMMRRLLFILVILVMSGAATLLSARADQNDPRLDTLFGNLQTTGSTSEAAGYVEQIWQIWIEHKDPGVNDRMALGIDAMSRNDLGTALGVFNSIVESNPAFAEGWNKRATVYYLMGQVPESLEDVEVTLNLEPRHFGALSGRGLLYSATGDYPDALRAFEEAVAVNPFLASIQQRIDMLKSMIGESEI